MIEPTFLFDYPVELSPAGQGPPVRPGWWTFEAFARGMEFANGYSELNDPDDQRARFEASARTPPRAMRRRIPFDEAYVGASSTGCRRRAGSGSGSTGW